MSNETNEFLFGGGGQAARFDDLGDSVKGTITEVRLAQQTDMESNQPLTWTDGRPRMQLIVTLQTEQRNGDEDDGTRRIYAKGGNYETASGSGVSMKDAIAKAVRDSGSDSLDQGGTLQVAYTGTGKKTNRAFNAPKLYKARYEPPKQSVQADELFGDDEKDPF